MNANISTKKGDARVYDVNNNMADVSSDGGVQTPVGVSGNHWVISVVKDMVRNCNKLVKLCL